MTLPTPYRNYINKLLEEYPNVKFTSNLIPPKLLVGINNIHRSKTGLRKILYHIAYIIYNHMKEDKLRLKELQSVEWARTDLLAHGIYYTDHRIQMWTEDEVKYFSNMLVFDHELYHYWAHVNNLDIYKIHQVDPYYISTPLTIEQAILSEILIIEKVDDILIGRFNWKKVLTITEQEIKEIKENI